MSSPKSRWKTVPSDIPQELILGPILFHIFINLDHGREFVLSKFSYHIKLRGVTDKAGGCATIQSDLNSLEKRSDGNLSMFNEGKRKVLHLGRNNHYRLVAHCLESSFAEKTQGVLVGTKWTMIQQCSYEAKKANSLLGCIRQSFASKLRKVFPFYPAPVRQICWSAPSSPGLPSKREKETYWSESSEVTQR
ncbi:rna-directed dna polymerase from mobile element jockey-like [Limosa lapponica baueri]|uniref:Rna-directed dna polymerase from mobile element jockey-like n=1 Tax=Limosa lapponica baueri TaxID=1758121 RepID=A0A2I0U8Y3_LIMLA|nr:rna-directed dna polymerase from mobile element jockey-like [Limosa lapponica baueri]